MRMIPIEAKSIDKATNKVTVTAGEAKQFANIAEAVKDYGGEDKVLAIINMHTKIRALDALRKNASPSLMKMFKSASPEAQEKIKKLLGMA